MGWDTEFWGVPVANAETVDGLSAWAAENTVGLVCLLVGADEIDEIHEAQSNGFRLMDIRVTLEMSLLNMAVFIDPRPIAEHEHDTVAELARTAFRLTRFYADPRLPDDRCDDLYETWVRKGIAAGNCLVVGSGPAGFVTVGLEEEQASIDLIAVSRSLHGDGFGTTLVISAAKWAWQRGATSMKVVTQGRNIPALRTFEAAGFRVTNTSVWLHKWYDPAPRKR